RRAVLDSDRTALRLDRKPAERKPQSRRFIAGCAPERFGAVWLEDSGSLFLRHSGPFIVDRDVCSVRGTGDDHAHLLLDLRVLYGVDHEILDDASCELGIAVTSRIA